jgi:hypothetical protein
MPRRLVKAIAVLPILPMSWLFRMGWLRFETGSFLVAVVPGSLGKWLRQAWYQRTLPRCGTGLNLNWMAFIYMPDTTLGEGVYVGPFSSIVSADIGDHVMLATRVSIVRGRHQHGYARLDIPMKHQPGQPVRLKIGSDVWIGTAAVIMADVAAGTIVGAGAVVTKVFEPYSILGGVPARVIGRRGPQPASEHMQLAAA